MELFVYSRRAMEAVRPHEVPHIILSITSGVEDVARLPTNAMCKGVLRLVFVDAEEASDLYTETALFSRDQADQVWRFIVEHRDHVDRIVIHCDAGMSRSPAVAAAISVAWGRDPAEWMSGRYRPNMRVYRMLVEARPL